MKKLLILTTSAVLVGGLLFSASGSAAAGIQLHKAGSTYTGSFRSASGSQVSLTTRLKDGKPSRILSLYYEGLPSTCSQTGPGTLDTTSEGLLFGSGSRVTKGRRFSRSSTSGPPDAQGTLELVGRFSKNFRSVAGTIRSTQHFLAVGGLPEEDCVSEVVGFRAGR